MTFYAELAREFSFESAHYLPNVPEGHKCGRMHGHSYTVGIHVRGAVDEHTGFVQDFGDLSAAFAPIGKQLDHCLLNEIDGLENPTSEHLARWLWERLSGELPLLHAIVVSETPRSRCTYRGQANGGE
ncbi:6-carboxytetrahydropterin synthase QueD [Microbacterium sp. B35-30]|uniref:6-carboxytetrahydropterin synthase QueD n=1 Tax=Microbacterium sp. B35-30 TaxID=1962642 RepID=UPI0013D89C1C|nr:6-carboxytetrahydropterin synthase QueD [Microbacterium sp. B35-30]KAF2418118.1 6-carboxytetrahydropterin synthase QueD [Microbacterium sp. B35-30]